MRYTTTDGFVSVFIVSPLFRHHFHSFLIIPKNSKRNNIIFPKQNIPLGPKMLPGGMFVCSRQLLSVVNPFAADAFDGFLRVDLGAAVVKVDQMVAVVAHAHFLHVGKLAQAVAALDALH